MSNSNIFNLSRQNLKRIENLPVDVHFNVLVLDQNEISRIENLENFPNLFELSIVENQLVDIRNLVRLRFIQKLNLANNRIESIDVCRNLENLITINVCHNNIPSLAALNNCRLLQSIEASHNVIQNVEDFSQLIALKMLNLQKNFLNSIDLVTRYWPKSLQNVNISQNEIEDLTEIENLLTFIELKHLSIAENPCLTVVDERNIAQKLFDYRPFVLNWCLSIETLDGVFVTRKETLKAEWLFSQGKGRSFHSGEHIELVQYLIKVCGINPSEKDELQLSRVLFQQELQEIRQSRDGECTPRLTSQSCDSGRDLFRTFTSPYKGVNETIRSPREKPLPIYNANRYSPRTTTRGPSASTSYHVRSSKTAIRHFNSRIRRNSTRSAPLRATTITEQSTDVENIFLSSVFEIQEKFSRTIELQASALTALQAKINTQLYEHQRQIDELIEENRFLVQRVRQLELHSNEQTNENSILYPPVRVHISKRDTKSFFLHWIPNPQNENKIVEGYRIFIDDRLIGTIDSGRFEAIIDSIRDEGEYRIKLRSFNEQNESQDSNIVVARFRRQNSTNEFEFNPMIDELVNSNREQHQIPIVNHDKSQNSTPEHSPNLGKQILLTESSSTSPTKTGILSRLTKSPFRIHRNPSSSS